jgi:ATP-dependent DNA helicase RecG
VWGTDDKKRTPKMRQLVSKASGQLIRRRVDDVSALTSEVYASLVDHLDGMGALRVPPFDTSACDGATLTNLSRERIEWFLQTARRERGFPLKGITQTKALLTHLNLLDGAKPTNAAMLLFGTNPQRFHRTAEIKCISCHGTEYRRPFASLPSTKRPLERAALPPSVTWKPWCVWAFSSGGEKSAGPTIFLDTK